MVFRTGDVGIGLPVTTSVGPPDDADAVCVAAPSSSPLLKPLLIFAAPSESSFEGRTPNDWDLGTLDL